MSILFRQRLENCILRRDPSADSNDFLKIVFANFGYWEYYSNFLTNYLRSVCQNRFLHVHRTNFGETNYWKVCFFSFWYCAGKFQPMFVNFWHLLSKVQGNLLMKNTVSRKSVPLHKFRPLSKNRSALVVVFWASCQFCNLRVQQNLSENFFQTKILSSTFLDFEKHVFWMSVKLFPVGLSELLSSSPQEQLGEKCFFQKRFYFLSISDIDQKKSVSASQISVSCPKCFQCVHRNL